MTNSKNTTFTVYMYEQEKEYLKWLVLQKPKIETGGDLFGLWQSPDAVIVQLITGPGEHCYRTETSFYQDINYLTATGKELTSCQGLCNIGEWHSHHKIGLASPSEGDQNTVWKHMLAESSGRFLLFIASISGSNKHPNVNIGCFMFSSKTRTMSQGLLEPLPGRSPIRTRFNDVDFKPGPEEGVDWDHFVKAVTAGHEQQVNNNSAEDKIILSLPEQVNQNQNKPRREEKERHGKRTLSANDRMDFKSSREINQNKQNQNTSREHHGVKTISAEGKSHPKSPKENTQPQEPSKPHEKERRSTERTKLTSHTPSSYDSTNQPKKQTFKTPSKQTTSTRGDAVTRQPGSRLQDVTSRTRIDSSNSRKGNSSIFRCCICDKCNELDEE